MSRERREHAAKMKQLKEMFRQQHEEYSRSWEQHSNHHSVNGDYDWMASFTSGRLRILEIGTGSGIGTVALCKHGGSVVSIDPNPYCLELAEKQIQESGYPVVVARRGELRIIPPSQYTTDFKVVKVNGLQKGATLIEGDISPSEDHNLTSWLKSIDLFDAVVCWNMGTDPSGYSSVQGGPTDYRLLIQNDVYDIADLILQPGGIVHIVDRADDPGSREMEVRTEIVSIHREQAEPTSLVLDEMSLTSRRYDPPSDRTGISVTTLAQLGNVERSKNMLFWSIVARKPQ